MIGDKYEHTIEEDCIVPLLGGNGEVFCSFAVLFEDGLGKWLDAVCSEDEDVRNNAIDNGLTLNFKIESILDNFIDGAESFLSGSLCAHEKPKLIALRSTYQREIDRIDLLLSDRVWK